MRRLEAEMMSDPQAQRTTQADEGLRLYSLSRPAQGLASCEFMHAGRGQERFYWREGGRKESFAGFGAAAELKAWGKDRFKEIERQARELFAGAVIRNPERWAAAPRLVGGFAFRDDFVPDDTWAAFHPAHFILPHFQLSQAGDETWLTINALAPAKEEEGNVLPQLEEALEMRLEWLLRSAQSGPEGVPCQEIGAGYEMNGLRHERVGKIQVRYPMSPEDWERMVWKAIDTIRRGELKKVVLARMCEIRSQVRIPVEAALWFLDEQYEGCYRFLFEPRPGHAFLGATPELLAEVQGDRLETMALAGSIRRGSSREEDDALKEALMASGKDRHEHQLVLEAIERRLTGRVVESWIPEKPEVLTLSNIHHLHTPIRARLSSREGVVALVEQLHPTPALGGTPRAEALAFIREEEPVTRGWYAGPVGWIGPELEGVFAVAIRSAVVQEERAWLYAGGGIVADSEPEKEWEETALKFKPMLHALDIHSEVLSRA